MLDDRTPYRPLGAALWSWLLGGLSALLLLACLAPGAAQRRDRPPAWWPWPTSVALFGLSTLLLLKQHLWLGWVARRLCSSGFAATLLSAGEFARSALLERERLYRHSGQLPARTGSAPGGHCRSPVPRCAPLAREATVLHADLRNFSAYCAGRPPEETAMVLHLFFTTASRIVEAHGGVVEQMVGDSLLAVWNGSAPCRTDHGARALDAAEELWRVCTPQLPRIASRHVPPLDLGIGVETGTVLIGSFGPAARRTHAVLGEAVTIATRLQALTGELAHPILIGAAVATARADPGRTHRLGDFLLAGLTEPRTVYAIPVKYPAGHLRLVFDAEAEQQTSRLTVDAAALAAVEYRPPLPQPLPREGEGSRRVER
jgi:adenylate cyclase